MKKYLLFTFFIFLLNNFNAQELVRWSNTDLSPNISNNKINADKLLFKTTMTAEDSWYNNVKYYQYNTSNWPSPNTANVNLDTFDENKYIQFAIEPTSGNKIKLSQFGFTYRIDANSAKIKIDYSFNSDFKDSKSLLSSTLINQTNWTDFVIKDFKTIPEQIVPNGKKLYIRIYIANTYNRFFIRLLKDKNDGPYFSGTVTQDTPTVPITTDDTASTSKNNEVAINVLENDLYQGNVTLNIPSQPQNGIVTINSNNQAVYTPKTNFVGDDVFYYTATNAIGMSRLTKVSVKVTNEVNIGLIRWNNTNFSGSILNPAIANTTIRASGITMTTATWETPIYYLNNWGNNTPIDYNKYVEFILDNKSDTKNIILNDFSFDYRATGDGQYTIQYSKDSSFKNGVKVLADNVNAITNFGSKSFPFNRETLKAGEKLYIRLLVVHY